MVVSPSTDIVTFSPHQLYYCPHLLESSIHSGRGTWATISPSPPCSGENETMSVEEDTTMLYYSIDHPDPDNNFTVTVVPINGAGPGEDVIKCIQIRIPIIMSTKGKFIPTL